MDEKNIRKYAKLMQELGLTGLEIKENGSELRLERMERAAPAAAAVPVISALPAQEPAAVSIPAAEQVPDDCIEISSPMVGVFYSAPAENAQPFVSVGDPVKKGDVLCIIEAMKLMNEITAEEMGTVREVCLEDATPVEYGTVLFYIEPHEPVPTVAEAAQ